MGGVNQPRRPFFAHRQGDQHVQSQERQVGQILLVQRLPLEMGMNQSEPPQPQGSCSLAGEVGNSNAFLVADDDEFNPSPSPDKDPYLAANFTGKFGKKPGNLGCHHRLSGNPPAINALDSLDLAGFQPEGISVNPSDRGPPFAPSKFRWYKAKRNKDGM